MTQDPTASWAQECEVHGLCECGVPVRRMVPRQLLSDTANYQGKCFYRGKAVILLQNQNLHAIHCSLLHVSFMKSSTDISSREMFNKSK